MGLFLLVTPKFLRENLRYTILVIAVVAAIVMPTPDAATMLTVMVTMLALYLLAEIRWNQ
jgi:sec-independent protein translocase protein TatC